MTDDPALWQRAYDEAISHGYNDENAQRIAEDTIVQERGMVNIRRLDARLKNAKTQRRKRSKAARASRKANR